ncbi:MAG: DUF5103 domain-containing protein [Chitinophagaceae bacterium]|nr:MAG: DUF5103 domain-containing protein [Chitinophagaceae bacterium]
MRLLRFALFILLATLATPAFCQQEEMIYKPYIATLQFHQYGQQQGLPVYQLNSGDQVILSFDDMEGSLKNYYYTYVLCDYNWQPVNLNQFDYIKGFTQNRISNYRYSSIAFTRYTHYQAILPDKNAAVPTRSGNYLLKVFLDGDLNKTVFTKRFYVLEQKANVIAEIVQPYTPQYFTTHQKVKFSASIKDINSFSAAQQVKAVILQNNRWDNALKDITPTFVRGNTLEYNSENIGIFEGGKEWRWLDLRSFRLQSDRVARANYNKTSTELFLKPDADRRAQRYVYFPDYNGMYNISTYETINPLWQGDYATVYFSYLPPDGLPYPQQDVYLRGAFTGYALNEKWRMKYNEETKMYEASAFLKQGYYNYEYVLAKQGNDKQATALEGNYWETENSYTILIYYKSFTDRSDQLIGVSQVNSRKDRPGFSF